MLDRKRIFGTHKNIATWLFAGVVLPGASIFADDNIVPPPAPPPQVTLRYRDLTNRQDFKFKMLGVGNSTKPVGDMHFDYPTASFPISGLDPAITSYCVEPLVPMFAGSSYPFTVDTINQPKFYGDPETVEGVKQTDRRAFFIKELYGKYYQETLKDPKLAAPAFQAALWELTQEKDLPDGPMPFNLYTGSFQADYANPEQAPEFVRQAQTYVQNLSGDEAAFTDNSFFKGTEIVRLTAVRSPEGVIAQSQFVLRNLPISAASAGGSIGQAGGNSGSAPLAGGGLGGPVGSGTGGAPGFGGTGFPFIASPGSSGPITEFSPTSPITTASTPTENIEGPSSQGPSESQPVSEPTPSDSTSPPPPPSPSTSPLPPAPSEFGPPTPPPPPAPPTPLTPESPGTPPTPGVPAPPALLLGALGVGLLALRRAFARKAERPLSDTV